jgi:hypothetical protein
MPAPAWHTVLDISIIDCNCTGLTLCTAGLQDTSGPSLNILIKLMAVESLVFAPFFSYMGAGEGLIFQFFQG